MHHGRGAGRECPLAGPGERSRVQGLAASWQSRGARVGFKLDTTSGGYARPAFERPAGDSRPSAPTSENRLAARTKVTKLPNIVYPAISIRFRRVCLRASCAGVMCRTEPLLRN